MPAKKPPAEDEKPQRQRFEEAAQKAEADDDSERFEQLVGKIGRVPVEKLTPRKKKD